MANQTTFRGAFSPLAINRRTQPMPICRLRLPPALAVNRLHEPTKTDRHLPNLTTSNQPSNANSQCFPRPHCRFSAAGLGRKNLDQPPVNQQPAAPTLSRRAAYPSEGGAADAAHAI